MKKYELYKAVKWQVENFAEDCGYTLSELWAVVTGKDATAGVDREMFWKNTCLEDYRNKARY